MIYQFDDFQDFFSYEFIILLYLIVILCENYSIGIEILYWTCDRSILFKHKIQVRKPGGKTIYMPLIHELSWWIALGVLEAWSLESSQIGLRHLLYSCGQIT